MFGSSWGWCATSLEWAPGLGLLLLWRQEWIGLGRLGWLGRAEAAEQVLLWWSLVKDACLLLSCHWLNVLALVCWGFFLGRGAGGGSALRVPTLFLILCGEEGTAFVIIGIQGDGHLVGLPFCHPYAVEVFVGLLLEHVDLIRSE